MKSVQRIRILMSCGIDEESIQEAARGVVKTLKQLADQDHSRHIASDSGEYLAEGHKKLKVVPQMSLKIDLDVELRTGRS